MSDEQTAPQSPAEAEKPTHDPFQAPVGLADVDGAALNAAARITHTTALAALTEAHAAVSEKLQQIKSIPGSKVCSGAAIALAAAATTLFAEIGYVQELIAHLPPVPAQ